MAKEFSKDNYINIPGFAITDLKLSGNELIVFSIIHGFSQDGQTEFNGSLNYLASALNSSRQTVINILKSLTEKQLISKKETIINNIKFNSYSYNLTGSQNFVPLVKKSEKVVKKFDRGSQKILPNNIYNNIDNNIKNNNSIGQNKNFATPTQENQVDLYDAINEVENEKTSLKTEKEKRKKVAPKKEKEIFIDQLVLEGVLEENAIILANERVKNKKSVSSIVYKNIIKECKENNIDINHAVEVMVIKGWQGFKAQWYFNFLNENNNEQQANNTNGSNTNSNSGSNKIDRESLFKRLAENNEMRNKFM